MKMNILRMTWLITISVPGLLAHQPAAATDKFLLLNYSPDGFSTHASSSTIMNYVAQKFGAANQASALKVGVACIYYPGASWGGFQKELTLMQNDLARARNLGIPILVQVDTENWLPASLLNWYDPTLAGFNPAKTADVEWYGWDQSLAVKLCWRNWGFPFRLGPAPNLLSPAFQAHEKSIYDLFISAVLQWYNNLPADKKWLFVGWKCGWESSMNANYRFFPNGNSYYGTPDDPPWSDNYQPLGYNAARTAGIKTNGVLTSSDYAKIVGKHLSYLAKMAFDAGIPKAKITVHGTYYSTMQENLDALVNPYGKPGVSFYGSSGNPLKLNSSLILPVHYAEANYGASGYGYGEFNLFTTDYNTWYSWFRSALHDDPDCVYQALFNYDSMYGQPNVEQAMLDAMALYPPTPTITAHPASLSATQASTASFSVSAYGQGTLSYQWQFNQTNISGATGSSYAVSNVCPAHAGGYSVLVSNLHGACTSFAAVLSFQPPLTNSPGCIPAPAGLVNWWTADGNADDLAGNLSGTPQGNLCYAPGIAGLAFRFDGTNYLLPFATNIPAPWTACFWVNRQNAPGRSAALLADLTWSLKLEQYNGTRRVGLTQSGVADYLFSPAYTAPVGTWVHLGFVASAGNTSLYVDGILRGAVAVSIPLPRSFIGRTMAGSLDEILTFNRALAASEIAAVYSASSAGFYRAPQFSGAAQSDGQVRLNMAGLTGRGFTLYSSASLSNWNVLTNLLNPNGTNQFTETNVPGTPQKFYRLSQP